MLLQNIINQTDITTLGNYPKQIISQPSFLPDLLHLSVHLKPKEIRDKAASRAAELRPENGEVAGGTTAKRPQPDTEVQTEQVITMNL